ncbi:GNAT family N-acetyltransferase [Cellulomonas fengjieae]|uniref:GNAT family N-acetyltransferase n=1 Tax=Cellulomonas fengjieae TaxID=2819978 RepID=A0ABS3SKW5_9CELL|nr:GNAT family N-acetyltransferase [Cellulomonas fengjieae]MBO3085999.1 GNAT family N-acetyltransferase [Cellulomonas fengjieae]MBO3103948.1 GNAT family N-acetyltransferase [Cellulomonas fengjieae]QVI65931.1 GNAT family N-acetyltransferase [Cellulomonas fengjieae]
MDRHELVEYVRARKDGIVSTIGPDGSPQAAYLGLTATDGGDLVFDSHASARKIANLRRDPRVAVVVGGADRTTLQCEGIADVPVGAEREACARAYLDAFPRFQASLADDGIVLVRVRLHWARFGDYRPGTSSSEDVELHPSVRRVRADEWETARDLRLDALRDEAAGIAFLETFEHASAAPDQLYRDRTAHAADGDEVAQFVAVDGGTWVGSVTVLVQRAGSVDYHGTTIERSRAALVGVYVRPDQRGTGLIDRLVETAADWSRARGVDQLALGVHRDNARAQGAYRRAGFAPSGVTFTSSIGPEIEMVRAL